MADVEQRNRLRIAMWLVLAGLVLVCGMAVVLLISWSGEAGPPEHKPMQALSAAEKLRLSEALKRVLFLTVVLAVIFAFGCLALLRWSRHFRRRLLRRPRPPTPAEDAWSMYRLPESEEPPSGGNGNQSNLDEEP